MHDPTRWLHIDQRMVLLCVCMCARGVRVCAVRVRAFAVCVRVVWCVVRVCVCARVCCYTMMSKVPRMTMNACHLHLQVFCQISSLGREVEIPFPLSK